MADEPLDPELRELVPLFVDEVRDRLERLLGLAPLLPDEAATTEVKRELHTIKGAARMLQVGAVAELAHAAEELMEAAPEGLGAALTRVADRLAAMVDRVAAGKRPQPAVDLLGEIAAAAGAPAASGPTAGAPAATASDAGPPAAPDAGAAAASKGRQPAAVSNPALSDVRVDAGALDRVADSATQVRILALATRGSIDRIYDLARLSEEGLREEQPRQVLAVLGTMLRRLAADVESSQRRLLRSAEDGLDRLLTLQLQPLRGYLLHLARYARDLARSLGREVEVEIEGEETRLDRRIARELDESLLHLVRNAVDHGIEAPASRERAGKPKVGKLRLSAQAEGGRVRLEIADDGAGIDPQFVAKQAVAAGLVEPAAAEVLGREELFRLLFAPGFSTRAKVSEISGRGMGLDVVAASVNRLGGEVFLTAEPGQGTRVTVDVPVARRGEQVLLARVGKARFAIPSPAIREVIRIGPEDILERDGRSFARRNGRLIAFVPLADLFGQKAVERPLLLIGEVSGQPLALAVDAIEGEEEVLVRPMTRAAAIEAAVDGMALLASGQPIGVLSAAVLAKRELMRVAHPVVPVAAPAELVKVLLVDDSLVTREMERRLLEDAGFAVTAAADAEEGLNHLGESDFDCLVTDIEMPGMNGYELTRHLRQTPKVAHLPIIVVSTRDRPEDRLEGLQAGADAYLTKQGLDAGELVDLVRRLSGSR